MNDKDKREFFDEFMDLYGDANDYVISGNELVERRNDLVQDVWQWVEARKLEWEREAVEGALNALIKDVVEGLRKSIPWSDFEATEKYLRSKNLTSQNKNHER